MAVNTKIALVTGSSRGLGKNMAIAIAKKGIDVIITYNSKKEEADEVVKEIENLGQKAASLQLNVAESNTFDSFLENISLTLKNTFKTDKFDFLVNNAGIGIHNSFVGTTEAEFDQLTNIHFKGPFFLTQKALSIMNDGGGIINISSGLARFSFPGYAAYASMKGAIETLTKYQAKELGERQIRANVVAPGAIETDFGGGAVRDNEELNKTIAGVTALGRVGLPDDIGGVVAFLCTEDARWVNAQRIEVSGGMYL
ncbi:SDR family NAD(P)-dependent oxidoreductase [Flavobacterium flavigenum]|uniref:SDR family NAD(P)-dependent oxidoreductase n=1 Tax=Flavobacterium flavigenum TaxID=3003258 RepID=UPI0022AC2F7C|nr:SDR family oxidoreductase [Flavobacterium flavigenum]